MKLNLSSKQIIETNEITELIDSDGWYVIMSDGSTVKVDKMDISAIFIVITKEQKAHIIRNLKEPVEVITHVTEEYISEIIKNSKIATHKFFDRCFVMTAMLPNKYIITVSSTTTDHNDYSDKYSYDLCRKKLRSKIRELESYRLMNRLHEGDTSNEPIQ